MRLIPKTNVFPRKTTAASMGNKKKHCLKEITAANRDQSKAIVFPRKNDPSKYRQIKKPSFYKSKRPQQMKAIPNTTDFPWKTTPANKGNLKTIVSQIHTTPSKSGPFLKQQFFQGTTPANISKSKNRRFTSK